MPESNPIDDLVRATLADLETKIDEISTNKQADDTDEQLMEKLTTAIKECLSDAFSKIEESQKQTFYKKLSEHLHPDTMKEKQPDLHTKLTSLNGVAVPQKALDDYKDQGFSNVFDDIAADPMKGVKKFAETLGNKLSSMLFEYKRYPTPINYLVNIMSWMVNIGLILALITATIVFLTIAVIAGIVDFIKNDFANLLTNDQYELEITKFQLENPMQEDIKPYGWRKVVLMAKAFGHAIAKPLSGSVGDKILSVLIVRPLRVLLIVPFIAATAAIEFVAIANSLFLLASIVAAVAVKIVTLVVLNSPLYLLDSLRYVGRSIKAACVKKTESALRKENDYDFESTHDNSNSHSKMREAMDTVPPSAEKTSGVTPAEQGTYTKLHAKVSPTPAPSNEPTFEDAPAAAPI